MRRLLFITYFSFLLPAVAAASPSSTQYATLSALAVGNLVLHFQSPPQTAGWKGGILFDDTIRDGLRLGSRSGRDTVQTVGNLLMAGLVAYPLLADAVADRWLSAKRPDAALQLTLIASQSFLVTGFLRQLSSWLVGRERPFQRECSAQPDYDPDCGGEESRESFFSGHAAFSFTAAGLVCTTRETLSLHGGNVPCYVAVGAATAVSLSRLLADQHYTSDVLFGAAVGWISGYYLPKWLNYLAGEGVVSPEISARGAGIRFLWAL